MRSLTATSEIPAYQPMLTQRKITIVMNSDMPCLLPVDHQLRGEPLSDTLGRGDFADFPGMMNASV